ncbi:hypothetical protein FQZ97_1241930 [compost metagenome]
MCVDGQSQQCQAFAHIRQARRHIKRTTDRNVSQGALQLWQMIAKPIVEVDHICMTQCHGAEDMLGYRCVADNGVGCERNPSRETFQATCISKLNALRIEPDNNAARFILAPDSGIKLCRQ